MAGNHISSQNIKETGIRMLEWIVQCFEGLRGSSVLKSGDLKCKISNEWKFGDIQKLYMKLKLQLLVKYHVS